MQKLVNALAVAAFLLSGLLTAGVVVLLANMPKLQQMAMDSLRDQVLFMVNEAAGSAVEEMMPSLPTETGPQIPLNAIKAPTDF